MHKPRASALRKVVLDGNLEAKCGIVAPVGQPREAAVSGMGQGDARRIACHDERQRWASALRGESLDRTPPYSSAISRRQSRRLMDIGHHLFQVFGADADSAAPSVGTVQLPGPVRTVAWALAANESLLQAPGGELRARR